MGDRVDDRMKDRVQARVQDHQNVDVSVAGYRLLRQIGCGASGSVHLAEHQATQQVVALKIVPLPAGPMRAAAGTQFLEAASAAGRLLHPHIVQVHEAGLLGDIAWLAMEPLAGGDLARYTRPPRLLPEALVLRLCSRLAGALAHAHRQGVVHRDLKPANVLVNWADDVVKLADFGLARTNAASHTGTGIVMGTPSYMAPEQLAGALPSPATDLYALGVLLFELLLGRLPHQGQSMGELLRQVANEAAPDIQTLRPDLPAALAQLVASLLAKTASARPRDGDAVALQLRLLSPALNKAPVASV